jgi:hypothetical protein
MKILFIEPCFVGFGGYFRAISLCTALSRKGVKVDLLLASKNEFQWGIKKTKINKNLNQYELPRFNFHFFFNGRILRGIIALFFGFFRKYDIVHACVPVQLESNIPAFILKLARKKVIMDWDDYWDVSTIYGEYKIMKKYVSFCEKKAPRFFENMVVVSNLLEKLAKDRGAKKVLKLINGINKDQFVPCSRDEGRKRLNLDLDKNYLLTFGHTYINDRAYLLFKTFEHIYRLDPEVKLFTNFDPYKVAKEQNLKNRIDMRCLNNIINLGYIKEEELRCYLGACDATIFIIGDSDNERANFPIRIGSYLNGESIIIMNDVNSEANNVLKKYSCAVLDKDIRTLSEKAIAMLKDREKQKELKINILKAKEELSWDNIIVGLIDFYKCV